MVDETYHDRALEAKESGGHLIVGGENYGQGSSREHAALAPRYLGLRVVVAKSYARLHWQNLANFGILPLSFTDEADHDRIEQGDELRLSGIREAVRAGREVTLENRTKDETYTVRHDLSDRQLDMILEGSLLRLFRRELAA